jgi:hypothetical protein
VANLKNLADKMPAAGSQAGSGAAGSSKHQTLKEDQFFSKPSSNRNGVQATQESESGMTFNRILDPSL